MNYGENMKKLIENRQKQVFKPMLFIHLNSFHQVSHFTKPAYSWNENLTRRQHKMSYRGNIISLPIFTFIIPFHHSGVSSNITSSESPHLTTLFKVTSQILSVTFPTLTLLIAFITNWNYLELSSMRVGT